MSTLSGPFCAKIASGEMSIMSLCSSRPTPPPPFPSLPFGNHRSSFIKKKKKCAEPAAEQSCRSSQSARPLHRPKKAEQGRCELWVTLGVLRYYKVGYLLIKVLPLSLALWVLGPDNITSPDTSHMPPPRTVRTSGCAGSPAQATSLSPSPCLPR